MKLINNIRFPYNVSDYISGMKSIAEKKGKDISSKITDFQLEYEINEDTLLKDELNIDLIFIVPDEGIKEDEVLHRVYKVMELDNWFFTTNKIVINKHKTKQVKKKSNLPNAQTYKIRKHIWKTEQFEKNPNLPNAPIFKIRHFIERKSTFIHRKRITKRLPENLKYRYIYAKWIAYNYNKSLIYYQNTKKEWDRFIGRINEQGAKKLNDNELSQLLLERKDLFPEFLKTNTHDRKFIKAKCHFNNIWFGLRVELFSEGWKVVDMFTLSDEDAVLLSSEIRLPNHLVANNDACNCFGCNYIDKCECSCVKTEKMQYQYCLNCKEFEPDYSNNSSDDIAFGKPVMELCNHPEYLTDGTVFYSGNDFEKPGYLGTHWPAFVTVDLLKPTKINVICFKLWDYSDPCNIITKKAREENQKMEYAYRLLISSDRQVWNVLFDSANDDYKYKKGWQCFSFRQKKIRYIRIHGLKNNKNSGFHLVKLKIFNKQNFNIKLIHCNFKRKEKGDGVPTFLKLINLAGKIQEIKLLCLERLAFLEKNKASTEEGSEHSFFSKISNNIDIQNDIVGRLLKRGHEVEIISAGIDEIKELVAQPVQREIEHDVDNEKKYFYVDFLFGLFQFIIVIILYLIDGYVRGFFVCYIFLVIVLLFFLKLFLKSEKDLPDGDKDKDPRESFIFSVCDSNKNTIKKEKDSSPRTEMHKLLLPAFGDIDNIDYNEKLGYHKIKTPGWIEFDFGKDTEMATNYIRFLLWDNCGSKKKQRSHRAYNYRVLYRAKKIDPWTILHDTMGHGSCGWQEFINSDTKNPWLIRYIRIYGISNSGATGSDELWLVRLGKSKNIYSKDLQYKIKNRIVKYYNNELSNEISSEIMKIVDWIRKRKITETYNQTEWEQSIKELLLTYKNIDANNYYQSLYNLFSEVSKFANSFINDNFSIDSSENLDFAPDIQTLVNATLLPVREANNMKERYEDYLRLLRICLVWAASLPMMNDCWTKHTDSMQFLATVILVIAMSLSLFFWKK